MKFQSGVHLVSLTIKAYKFWNTGDLPCHCIIRNIYIGICQQTLDTKVCNACIYVSANPRCPIWHQHRTYKLAYNDMNR